MRVNLLLFLRIKNEGNIKWNMFEKLIIVANEFDEKLEYHFMWSWSTRKCVRVRVCHESRSCFLWKTNIKFCVLLCFVFKIFYTVRLKLKLKCGSWFQCIIWPVKIRKEIATIHGYIVWIYCKQIKYIYRNLSNTHKSRRIFGYCGCRWWV